MRSAPLLPIAHPRTAVAAPPPPGRCGLSAGFPPKADGSSVVAPPPPWAAADIVSDADADDLNTRLRGVDWSVPAVSLPIDMPEDFTSGPFAPTPARDRVDTLLALSLIVIASLASVAIGVGLGWLAAVLN